MSYSIFYFLLIAEKAGIDLEKVARTKLAKNAEKYPVEEFYGSSRKYTKLNCNSED